MLRFALFVAGFGLLCATATSVVVGAPLSDDPLHEDIPALQPTHPRNEQQADLVTASAWFTQARVHFQREEFDAALRSYQRAWRYDQDATSILREIVPLAFELKRNAEAARYAVIMAEANPKDALLLRRLAQHLIDEREFARAIGLYEKSLELQADDRRDARHVLAKMEIGRLYFIEDQHDKAADSFAVVVEALESPEDFKLNEKTRDALLGEQGSTYTLFGEAFLDAGRLEEATAMFEKANQESANPPLLAYHLARVEIANDRPKAAIEQLEKYFSSDNTDAGTSAYELYEQALVALHDEEDAQQKLRERLEELHQDDSSNVPLTYFLAEKMADWEEHAKAAELFETALDETPTVTGYRGQIQVLLKLEDDERLLDTLSGAVERSGSLTRLGEVVDELTSEKDRLKRLIKKAQKRIKQGKANENADLALAVGLLALEAKDFDAAERLLEHAVDADGERRPAILENWGLQLFIADQFERATKVFRRAIDDRVAPRFDADFYYYLAGTLAFSGKTEEALAASKKSSELAEDSARYAGRGPWVLYHAKRFEDARTAYLEFLERFEGHHDDEDVRDAIRQAHLILSNIEIQVDNMPAAEEWLEKVLDEFPEDIGAMNDLGYLWSDQGKHLQRSLAMVTRAAEAEPDNVAYRDSVGWAHFRLGNFDEAIDHLERASKGDLPDGVMFDHLGDAYQAGGRQQDALKAWQRAIELFEEDEDEESAKKTRDKLKSAQQK